MCIEVCDRSHVPIDAVIGVLRLNSVDVSQRVDNKGRAVHVLVKGQVVETHYLPDDVPRHLLGRFAIKFDFGMGDFWNQDDPDTAPPPN